MVFPHTAIPEVGSGKPASVGDFCPFVPFGLTISFDMLFTFNLLLMSGFLWRSNLVIPNSGVKNHISAASSYISLRWFVLYLVVRGLVCLCDLDCESDVCGGSNPWQV
jgi:hypothetical protein